MSAVLRKLKISFLLIMLFGSVVAQAQPSAVFTNPVGNGADPWVVKYDNYYYVCKVSGRGIGVAKSSSLIKIGKMETVWKPAKNRWNSMSIWAPELHRIGKKWYIYYAAGSSGAPYINQRSGVLESVTDDPQGAYIEKAVLKTGDDPNDALKTIWAIDVTVTTINGQLYAVWSGWEKNNVTDKIPQHLYMAKMSNPWTIDGERVKISSPNQSWETGGTLDINEGPEFLEKNGNIFIVYSTRESWLPSYRLGLLRMKNTSASPLDPVNWIKTGPVFTGTAKVFGVGHASFTTSPDGTEDWIFYHAKKSNKPGWERDMRLQRFIWDKHGNPVFGTPIPAGVPIKKPSGEKNADDEQ